MLELYNTTNDVKRIPKYKYNGKYIIPPHGSVRIEDEQAYFFKPYARVGIVIRKPMGQVQEIEPETVEEVVPVVDEPVENIEVKDETEDVLGSSENESESVPVEEMEELEIDSNNAEDTIEEMEDIGSIELETVPVEPEPVLDEQEKEEIKEIESEQPKYTAEDLEDMNINKLRAIARELGIDITGIRKKKEIKKKIVENL